MVPAIASPTNDADDRRDRDLTLGWTGRLSLTVRILAVNVLALLLLAGGFFYLDSYRTLRWSAGVDTIAAATSRASRLAWAERLSRIRVRYESR